MKAAINVISKFWKCKMNETRSCQTSLSSHGIVWLAYIHRPDRPLIVGFAKTQSEACAEAMRQYEAKP
jgi:hypothetical protein